MAAKTELEEFRSEKDDFFAHDPRSPLTAEQRRGFKGLQYFQENPSLVINGKIDRDVPTRVVRMSTTRGGEQVYRPYGVVHFMVDDEPADVTLYAADDSHELFLPFRDATSRDESYGGGRYLDLHTHGDEVLIDFNYAYNPFCAYNPEWECPLPPSENWLQVPIRAGEKNFPGEKGEK